MPKGKSKIARKSTTKRVPRHPSAYVRHRGFAGAEEAKPKSKSNVGFGLLAFTGLLLVGTIAGHPKG